MCFPKAPKPDPAVKEAQMEARQRELDRLAAEKQKAVVAERRTIRGGGMRSLLTGAEGTPNYTPLGG